MQALTPNENQSAARKQGTRGRATISGAQYPLVPQHLVSPSAGTWPARPKSETRVRPCTSMRMFSGFRSLR
jgi:hypothetical protein